MTLLRIAISLSSLWPYFVWKREVRQENLRRAIQQRLDDVIGRAA